MIQQTNLEKDIARSIDRLRIVMVQHHAGPCIPAFHYSASLLNQYAKLKGPEEVRSDLFQDFYQLMEDFGRHDFSNITKNNQAVIDDILDIVDSELFIDCIRPDIYKSRGDNMKEAFEEMADLQDQMVTSKTGFKLKGSLKSITSGGFNSKKSIDSTPRLTSQESILGQYDELWQVVERSYREHNIDEAFKKATEYVGQLKGKVQIPENRQKMIDRIAEEYMAMVSFYEEFDKPGWQFDRETNGITLEYKVFTEEKQIAIRIHGEFDIPAVEFLAIVSEIDLMGEYVPFCYDCKELRQVSRNERIGTSKIYIPLLSDRETYFYAVGYDRMKQNGSLFFYSKTINEDTVFMQKHDYQVPEATQKYVRLQYKFFIVEYKPVTNKRAKIRLSSKIDMKMNYLPLFILNKSARVFALDYFKNIIEKVQSYKGSAWEKKVEEKPEMYEFFFKKIGEYFGQ